MRILWVAMTMLLAAPALAEGPRQFDLVCTAKKTVVRYRVDLDRGEWCMEECRGTRPFARVTAGTLVMVDEKAGTAGGFEGLTQVERSTGTWYSSSTVGRYTSTSRGQCEAAPFSGFPATKF